MLLVNVMNKRIFFVLILVSVVFSLVIFKIYKSKKESNCTYYLVQVGAFKSYDNLSTLSKKYENYIVREEDGLFKLFIGVTKSEEVYDKIIRMYSLTSSNYKKILRLNNKDFDRYITKLDELIKIASNQNETDTLVKEGLKELNKLLDNNKKK